MSKNIQGASGLRAGAAQVDITPALGIQIAGDIGRYRPVEEIRDPLFAKALVLQAGGKRICLLSLDILAITRHWADEIRNQAAARFGLDAQAVAVHITQNHAAPGVGHFFCWEDDCRWFPKEYPWLKGGDERYNPVVVEGSLKAIELALAAMQPATLKVGRGVDGRVAFNRRFIMRDGTGRSHPPTCDPNILCNEGPIDPEVGVMVLSGQDGKPLAACLHHTCHPVHGYPQRWISAGWPGAWSEGVRRLLGDGCVPLVINGFCGNIHYHNHLDPASDDDYKSMGRKLTETTERVLPTLRAVENPTLDWRVRDLRIPMRKLTDAEVQEAQQMLKDHPEPVWRDAAKTAVEWDWVYAAERLDLHDHYQRDPMFDYILQVLRLGDIAIVVAGGEPFVEEQLRIKRESPAPFTFMAHMSNGYVGYIPTREALSRGGYETRVSNGSKLAPEALGMIGDASLAMIRELFDA